jgi:structural maintenance of chromosome 1
LVDHCEPVHRKYQVAITKVMGKSMDAIVVDTEKTARECIQFMKEQHLATETFYPLDYIEAPNLDDRLRYACLLIASQHISSFRHVCMF